MDFEELLDQYVSDTEETPDPVKYEGEEFSSLADKYAEEQVALSEEIPRAAIKGATFGFSQLLEAVVDAELEDKPVDVALYNIRQQERKAREEMPVGMFTAELAGAIPTGMGMSTAMTRRGITSMTAQGGIEGGLYALGTEGPEAVPLGAVAGGVVGRAFDFMGSRSTPDAVPSPEEPIEAAKSKIWMGEDLSDDELWSAIDAFRLRETIEANRPLFEKAEDVRVQTDKAAKKGQAAEEDFPTPVEPITLERTLREFTEGLDEEAENLARDRMVNLIGKRGGLRAREDIEELIELDKMFTGSGPAPKSPGPFRKWLLRSFVPVSNIMNDYIDPRVGSFFERAVETAMRKNASFVDQSLVPAGKLGVVDVFNDREVKRLVLDLWRKPKNIRKVRAAVARSTGPEGVAAFDRWLGYARQKNAEARGRLFKRGEDEGFDENYFHVMTTKEVREGLDAPVGEPYQESFSALKERKRKPASKMTDEEVDAYHNPMLTHSRWLTDQENLLEIQKKFGLRPSLTVKGTSGDFFNEVKSKLVRDGLDEGKATEAAKLMEEAWMGSRKAPPGPIRAFMNLAYAGTLAQFKTTVLNLHDVPVSMVNNGEAPTLRVLFNKTDKEFGKSLRQMIGEQNFGEFVRDYDNLIQNPGLWAKVAKGSKFVSDGSMFISGFRLMDEVGKGSVLRAAVESARDAARNGTLRQKFGNIFLPYELDMIEPYLKNGMKAKDMPPKVREKVEELAFTKLGEQQLISMAGRPVNYLSNPIMRPAYAMTGFAIKQMTLLRKNVYNELKRGNYKDAAIYAAKYVGYAGLGYGMINELRNAVFKKEAFEPEDILVGTLDQVAAAMTLNRLGDEYSRQMFVANPVEYLMTSFLPPGGLGEALGQAAMGDIKPLIERTPAAGDFMKYYLKEED